jgi:hypothetical protein
MTADAAGNDIGAVGIPISGNIGVAPVVADNILTSLEGAEEVLALPVGFRKLGLMKTDGGFNWTTEASGDRIEFFQSGYSIPSGLATATLEVGLAQHDPIVREVTWGKVPDANGYITIDAGGHATRYVVFTEEIFQNGWIERRQGVAVVTGATLDRSTRGEVRGTNLVFTFERSPYFDNAHFGQWMVDTNAA